jgi:hypothetical protein
MQQFSANIIAIVVESCANKCRKSEAKFNNNMLQLLLVGGNVDFSSPKTFNEHHSMNYMQAMKNIILQPTSIRAISLINILMTLFNKT